MKNFENLANLLELESLTLRIDVVRWGTTPDVGLDRPACIGIVSATPARPRPCNSLEMYR